jgi:hypothetical protein
MARDLNKKTHRRRSQDGGAHHSEDFTLGQRLKAKAVYILLNLFKEIDAHIVERNGYSALLVARRWTLSNIGAVVDV